MKDSIDRKLSQLGILFGERESASLIRILTIDLLSKPANIAFPDLSEDELLRLDNALDRILKHEPVQYVTGKSWFYGLEFIVDHRVLIPRPETEELVEKAIELIRKRNLSTVLDIGTGSGCIPVTLKVKLPSIHVSAMDISNKALEVANINSKKHCADICFFQSDILSEETLSDKNYDVIISNPPYINRNEEHHIGSGTFLFEPELALYSEEPMQFYNAILDYSLKYLNPGGVVLMECNEFYGMETKALALEKGFEHVDLIKDMQGKDRMIIIQQ